MAHPRHYHRSGRWLLATLLSALALLQSLGASAAEHDALPIPRFVSMKHGEVNLRVGPGRRYPVEWVYRRKEMPVEVIGQFDIWRKIRDWEGTVGWVIEQAISGRRTIIVTGETRGLHSAPDQAAGLVARLEPGVIAELVDCPADTLAWCRVKAPGASGWIRRSEIWGVYPEEIVQ